MMAARLIGLLATMLALVQMAHAFAITVTETTCARVYLTLSLTTAEIANAAALNVYSGATTVADNEISSFTFNGVYSATVTSYQWYAQFYTPIAASGPQTLTFRLLDDNNEVIPAYAGITQTINFQCGATLTSTTAAGAAPTSTSGSNAGSNSNSGSNSGSNSNGSNTSGASNSSTSSGSSSSTGAIAGGVVGGLAALAALGLLAFCLTRKKKRQQRAQQSRLNNNEADEAAFRAPNNDSTASLATAPETANTPMMRDIGTKNIFADPTTSAVFRRTIRLLDCVYCWQPGILEVVGGVGGAGAGAAAAAGGIGAAAIAARKQSRETVACSLAQPCFRS